MNANTLLVRYLVQTGFLKEEPDSAIYHNKLEGPLACLEKHKIASQTEALAHLRNSLNLNQVNFDQVLNQPGWNPERFVSILGSEFCWQHLVLPFRESENFIHVACINPFQDDTRKLLEFYLQKSIIYELCLEASLKSALHNYAPQAIDSNESSNGAATVVDVVDTNDENPDAAKASTQPIIQLCNKIIAEAIERGASDIHIEPSDSGLDVRIRVLGSMARVLSVPKKLQPYVITRFKIMGRMNISERRKPQDGRMRARIADRFIDVRLSSIPTAHGEKLVLRLLSGAAVNKDLSKLGIPNSIKDELLTALAGRGRMLLVTGPTGSGKSTSLYACLQNVINGELNVVTVEDPIEYRIRGINQIQVDEPAGVTFASALRSILRQDPDVIMIGEIRDQETASIAMQAAQTGHLVLSTLHTNDAPAAIRRLEQLGVPEFQIAAGLAGVLAQRLVRTLCPKCATPLPASEYETACKLLERQGIKNLPEKLMKNVGCSQCYQSGFSGRTGIYSYIKIDHELENLICQKASVNDLAECARKSGYASLGENALDLLASGTTTLDEVLPIIISDYSKAHHSVATVKPKALPTPNIATQPGNDCVGRTRILIVEDDSSLRQVLSMLLEKEMFEVVQAENGQDALEKLYQQPPQIVLCDLMMPVMDGREFLKRLKNNKQTSSIPIVMLTAADDENNEIDLIDLGADDFISKASSSSLMLSRIRKITSALR